VFRVRNAPKTIKEIELVRRIVYDGASVWRGVSNLEFVESIEQEADIEISFQNNVDGFPFNNQVIAHMVQNGNKSLIYFNDQLNWTFYSNKQGI
jgi:hypothetical protein